MGGHKYTDYLSEKYAADFKLATQHPFLKAAGEGSIDPEPLKEWLKQDYLFAYEGGIKYTASLLSRLPLAPTSTSIRSQIAEKAVPILAWSATNLVRETDYFLSIAAGHGLGVFEHRDLEKHGLLGEYAPVTRGYIDYLQTLGAVGSIEEGLVVLWTSEKIYNAAWSYAKSHRQTIANPNQTQVALVKLVDNWTTREFTEFVGRCEDMIDSLGIQLGSDVAERCEKVFRTTLWYEQRFWPSLEP